MAEAPLHLQKLAVKVAHDILEELYPARVADGTDSGGGSFGLKLLSQILQDLRNPLAFPMRTAG
jgi:hypothetical protein